MEKPKLTEIRRHPEAAPRSDLFKITRSKAEVDLAPNTVRRLIELGLPKYQLGKLILISRSEVDQFIRSGKAAPSK